MCKKIAHYCKDTLTRLSFACAKVNVCKNNEDFAQFIWQLETFVITLQCTKKQNAMLLQEFQKFTGSTPSEEYFNAIINPAYIASGLGKEDWCKQWQRKGYAIYKAVNDGKPHVIYRFKHEDYNLQAEAAARKKLCDIWEHVLQHPGRYHNPRGAIYAIYYNYNSMTRPNAFDRVRFYIDKL